MKDGPDLFLDYDPAPLEKKLREAFVGWQVREDALEQIQRPPGKVRIELTPAQISDSVISGDGVKRS